LQGLCQNVQGSVLIQLRLLELAKERLVLRVELADEGLQIPDVALGRTRG
jgi:hypothetical protein